MRKIGANLFQKNNIKNIFYLYFKKKKKGVVFKIMGILFLHKPNID